MNYSQIFEHAHSNNGSLTISLADLGHKEYEEVLNKVGLDINKVYKVFGRFYSFCYINGMVSVPIHDLSETYIIEFGVKDHIEYLEKHFAKLLAAKEYSSLLFLIDKPERFYWFEQLYDDIPVEDRYEIFMDIYTSSEYGFNTLDQSFVEEVFALRPKKEIKLEGDVITVYRGEQDKSTSYEEAYSWTTDYKTAQFFATRFGKNGGTIYKGKVNKSDIIDYLEDRQESEVIVMPNSVYDVEEVE